MDPASPLPAASLFREESLDHLAFETTADLEPLHEPVGQERVLEAVSFGVGIRRDGYNLFAIGRAAAGKWTLVKELLEKTAASEPVPKDLVYVHDFASPHAPKPLLLPPGRARALRDDVAHLVEELRATLPAAFESEEFRTRKSQLEDELKGRHEKELSALRKHAEQRGVAVLRTPMGFAVAPMMGGEVVTPDVFEKLPIERRQTLEQALEATREELSNALESLPRTEKELRQKMRALIRDVAGKAVKHLIDDLAKAWRDLTDVETYLRALEKDVLENVDDFLRAEGGSGGEAAMLDLGVTQGPLRFRRYQVNVLVDHADTKGAPVLYEDHPSYQRLVGRVEHISQFGALLTDHNLLKAGALHRANGGYLVMDVRQLLREPYAWEALRRALVSRELRVEALAQMLSLVTTTSLEATPIPLDIKVVLLGERELYYLLNQYEPDLGRLFKVVVDFEDVVPRSAETALLYARTIATISEQERLRPFDRTGVARVIERAARLAGDAGKLSAHRGELTDLLREADYWAGVAKRDVVSGDDVLQATSAAQHRESRIEERLLEETERGTLLIDTVGAVVGQINALTVLSLGRGAFGRPARITARVRLGRGDVIDVERQVALGGPVHSKGVLILSGFLGARYVADEPLSLEATLVFEQSYGHVEGDSASCAELCALLSALANVPIRQSFAITGSVNQNGDVQAIGGANEKIEGFFDLCVARGLTGEQGVLLPASNVRHLMLRKDLVEAVSEGKFAIYAISTVDQAIALLTGREAGERDAHGRFPDGSVNQLVETRLSLFAKRRMSAGK
jgi:lon-related putative ATP-dependent protease